MRLPESSMCQLLVLSVFEAGPLIETLDEQHNIILKRTNLPVHLGHGRAASLGIRIDVLF